MSSTTPYTPQDFGYPLMLEDYIPVPPLPTAVVDHCASCRTPGAKKICGQCKNMLYCSPACQERDWLSSHKLACKPYAKAIKQPIGKNMRRVLHFPANSAKPIFSVLAFDEEGTVSGLDYHFPGVPAQEIKKLSFHNRYFPYFIQINYDMNVKGERALFENKSLGLPFRGPVVVLAYDLDIALSGPALNADASIMRPLMEYVELLREYDGPKFVEQPQQRYTEAELDIIMGSASSSGEERA
ncbi:hypothetical protein J4E83_006067 [Alternaria metachromatica]|uniref:uncharacterized protein n=1 Tax=Alternaria metachromatica TaxID=283354 RepID=UPI0020C2FFAB|nr:uncharacterized protein J4E83_006067 [Alternaria metachromatica]KAI4617735.1 hypothetical protein J4E83_006067 [Alternaria metachromatica]